jgi:hypothetical protein
MQADFLDRPGYASGFARNVNLLRKEQQKPKAEFR